MVFFPPLFPLHPLAQMREAGAQMRPPPPPVGFAPLEGAPFLNRRPGRRHQDRAPLPSSESVTNEKKKPIRFRVVSEGLGFRCRDKERE